MIKYFIHHDTNIINVYVSNRKGSKYIKKNLIELQGEPENYIKVLGYFNIPLLVTHKSVRQK